MAMENQLAVETCMRRFPERRLASVPGKWLRLLREFVNERCGYDCRLFEVGGQQPVVDIHVGVIGAAAGLHEIANEGEARHAGLLEGDMIGGTDAVRSDRCGTEVGEGSEQRL